MTATAWARALGCAGALGMLAVAPPAWAEPAAPSKPTISVETPPPPPPVERTYHTHEGFYLRLSLGGAWGSTSQSFASGSGDTLSGTGGALDVMVGGTPARGLVLGGALLGSSLLDPNYDVNGLSASSKSNLGFGMLAAFIDAFPDPHNGFHLGGGFGPALVRLGARSSSSSASTEGVGGALWLGYDAWIAPEWSLGGMLRFAEARTSGGTGAFDQTDVTRSIVILFTALYH